MSLRDFINKFKYTQLRVSIIASKNIQMLRILFYEHAAKFHQLVIRIMDTTCQITLRINESIFHESANIYNTCI